jgi:5-carboxymethyl-2-hydroxymuconic-semialdehyde dehydrogenase
VKNSNFVRPTVRRRRQPDAHRPGGSSGPVACLIRSRRSRCHRESNDIACGLSSYVWTENLGRRTASPRIEAGMCFVNSQNVRDLRQPFGGTKASGIGREGGTWSYEVFLEPKNVAVSLGGHHIPRWGA